LKEVVEKIAGEIKARGIIPFSDFMNLALYCPDYGYYEKEEDKIGRRGDFFTSVSVGPLFGDLLAFQFAEWLSLADSGGTLYIAEAGAHRGDLAGDILGWLKINRPRIYERLEYYIIEPSVRRREWQKEFLGEFANSVVWIERPGALKEFDGIIFSNELLDAFPVKRFQWDGPQGKWFEMGVGFENETFEWQRMVEVSTAEIRAVTGLGLPHEVLSALPDGFKLDLSPDAQAWWTEAAASLKSGVLVTIDYGLTAEELVLPHRKEGTLRAYSRHGVSDDVLARPGDQDLTAHVNFSGLQAAGETAGLRTQFAGTQAQFLTQIASKIFDDSTSPPWSSKQNRQFQTLTHPEHLGERFRVLLQHRQGLKNQVTS
jgi:SAM-dependent MidA family methyltransferase